MRLFFLTIILLFNLIFLAANAAEKVSRDLFIHQFSHITNKDELSQVTINAIEQDNSGNVWIGTMVGLNRFDGVKVTKYLKENKNRSISDNMIKDIVKSDQNGVWVLTRRTLEYLHANGKREKVFTLSDYFDETKMGLYPQLKLTPNKELWIFHNLGILVLNTHGKLLANILLPEPLNTDNWIINNVVLKNETAYVATSLGLWLINLKTKTWHRELNWPSELNEVAQNIAINKEGDFIIVGNKNLYQIKNKQILLKKNLITLNIQTAVKSILVDKKEGYWFGTFSGLYHFSSDFKITQHYQHDKTNIASLGSNNINILMQDHEENLWIGSFNSGISLLSERAKAIKIFNKQSAGANEISDFNISDLLYNKQGLLWVGTVQGSLYAIDTKNKITKKVDYTSPHNNHASLSYIMSLYQTKNTLWISTLMGLFEYNLKTKQSIFWSKEKNNFPLIKVISVIKDSNQSVWALGHLYGLAKRDVNQDRFTSMHGSPSWQPEWNHLSFRGVTEYKNTLYFITLQGVLLSYNLEKKQFKQETFLMGERIDMRKLLPSKHGGLWIQGGESLFHYSFENYYLEKKFSAIDVGQSAIFSMITDQAGNIWMGGNRNVIYYDVSDDVYLELGEKDDVLQQEFNPGVAITDDGKIYLSAINNILEITPENLQIQKDHFAIRLSSIKRIESTDNTEILVNTPLSSDEIILNAKEYVELNFAPMYLNNKNNIKIRYRLNKGPWRLTNNWSAQIYSHHINYGSHDLEIQSKVDFDGFWETQFNFSLYNKNRFWTSPILYGFTFFILLLTLLYLFFIINKNKKRQTYHLRRQIIHETRRLKKESRSDKRFMFAVSYLFNSLFESFQKTQQTTSLSKKQQLASLLLCELGKELVFWKTTKNHKIGFQSHQIIESINALTNDIHFLDFEKKVEINIEDDIEFLIPLELLLFQLRLFFVQAYCIENIKLIYLRCNRNSARRAFFESVILINPSEHSEKNCLTTEAQIYHYSSLMHSLWKETNAELVNNSHGLKIEWQITIPIAQKWRGLSSEILTKEKNTLAKYTSEKRQLKNAFCLQPCQLITLGLNTQYKNYITHKTTQQTSINHFSLDFLSNENFTAFIHQQNLDNTAEPSVIVIELNIFEHNLINRLIELSNLLNIQGIIVLAPFSIYMQTIRIINEVKNILLIPQPIPESYLLYMINFFLSQRSTHELDNTLQQLTEKNKNTVISNNFSLVNNELSKQKWITKLELCVDKNYSNTSLDTEMLAHFMGMSARHLSRTLKAYLEQTPAEYIKNCRLTKAKSFLIDGKTIKQVAQKSGFASHTYFSTCFKAKYGCTPGQFINNQSQPNHH